MKNKFFRKIDELGRIVLPKEIRSMLNLQGGDELEIKADGNVIVLKRGEEKV